MDEKMGQTYINEEAANTLAARDYKQPQVVCYAIDHVICGGGTCTALGPCVYEEVSPTMKSAGVHSVCYGVDLYDQSVTGGGGNDKSSKWR